MIPVRNIMLRVSQTTLRRPVHLVCPRFFAVNAAADALEFMARGTQRHKIMFSVQNALESCKKDSKAKFDETVELVVQLNLDPKKPNQSLRGVVQLPHGTGKSVRVAVFARGEKADLARNAGATVVGAEDLVKNILEGDINFDRCIATPDVMPLVGRVARILGPRGLMPNPKLGTVTQNVEEAIKAAMGGQVEFRAEKKGIIHVGVGKLSFSPEALVDNIRVVLIALGKAKPEGVKGRYFLGGHLSSTMGKGYALHLQSIDPSSTRFMMAGDME